MHSRENGPCNIVALRFKWLLFSFCIKALLLASAAAQAPPSDQGVADTTDRDVVETAPVMIDGELLFRLRGVSAYPAEKRAESV